MAADLLSITDQLVSSLSAATFSSPCAAITAVRAYDPVFTLAELEMLRVSVIPPVVSQQVSTRDQTQAEYQISIGVQKRITGDTQAELDAATDALVNLVEEIGDHCMRLDLTGGSVTEVMIAPLYDPDQLRQYRVFTSVLTVTILAMRGV